MTDSRIAVHRDLGPGFTHSDEACACEPLIYEVDADDPRPSSVIADEITADVERRQRHD